MNTPPTLFKWSAWLSCTLLAALLCSITPGLQAAEPEDGVDARIARLSSPLSAAQILSIKGISLGVVSAHNSQRDTSGDTAQLADLKETLDELIESESASATPDEPATQNKRQARHEKRARARELVAKLRTRAASETAVVTNESALPQAMMASRRASLMKRWGDEIETLNDDNAPADRVSRLRKLRETLELSRYEHPDHIYVNPTPTMSWQAVKAPTRTPKTR